ncbi:hypothetical protein ACVXZ4_06600 [Lacisediminihabitans sp. FW035]
MIWIVYGGVGVLVFVVALAVWAVVVLLAEVGDEQDEATDEPDPQLLPERMRARSRAARY